MPNLRRRAVLTVLVGTIVAEGLVFGALALWPENGVAFALQAVLNLPGWIFTIGLLLVAGSWIPGDSQVAGIAMAVATVAVSVASWTGLTAWIFRQDRSEALTACYEALLIRPLLAVALVLFLGTGIWTGVALAGEEGANLPLFAFAGSVILLIVAARRE